MRVMLTVMLIGAICGSLLTPARGNGTSISIEPSSVSVTVGQKFTVQILVTGVVGMERFYFDIRWDASMMTYLQYTGNDNGLSCIRGDVSSGYGERTFTVWSMTPRFTGDAYWWSLQFECLAAGTASLLLASSYCEWRDDVNTYSFTTVSGATVQQNTPPPPETPTHHVGGEVFSANKAVIVAPYLIGIFSIIAAVSLVVRKKFT